MALALPALLSCLLTLGAAKAHADDGPATVEGKIFAVSASQIMVFADEEKHTFVISNTTKISLNGEPAKAKDLRQGQKVKVAYQEEEGKTVATSIMAEAEAPQPNLPGERS